MASTIKTNLFGTLGNDSGSIVATANTTLGGSNNNNSNSSPSPGGASSWFEEDDELLLSQLLLGEESDTLGGDGLDAKLDRLRGRLEQDVSRVVMGGSDGWWNALLRDATSSGFICSPQSAANVSANGGGKELPKSFNTPEGQDHLRALVDLLGIPQERAVKITLASLRSFASVTGASTNSTSTTSSTSPAPRVGSEPVNTPPSASGAESDKENDDSASSEQESKLRSLLGTKELFHRVLLRHRRQFLARLRVITESLRLEQENKEDDNDDSSDNSSGIGRFCASFLDRLDSQLTLNGKKRGLFQLLVRLATGPPLPGMGAGELPYSVDKLRGNAATNILEGGEESLLAIRNESSEALLVLLYDRIDGGVHRLDLHLVMEAASSCGEYEFGMSASEYSKRGSMLQGGIRGGRGIGWQERRGMVDHAMMELEGQESVNAAVVMEQTKCRLNGLWALICAECMGLWRANNSGNGNGANDGNSWVEQHPFFAGLDLTDNAAIEDGNNRGGKRGPSLSLNTGTAGNTTTPNEQAQKELEALCHTLRSLCDTVRARRQAAYTARKRNRSGESQAAEEDDDLGVQAPESIAILTLGLLLRLAHLSSPENTYLNKLGEWGQELAQVANDECGAFGYLHKVLELWMVKDPLGGTLGGRRGGIGKDVVESLVKRGEFEYGERLALMDEGGHTTDGGGEDVEDCLIVGDAASVVYASIGREILSSTIRAFRDALLSLQSRTSAVENIGMLSDLASVIYRNSNMLCEQFWLDWEEFCQQGADDMNDHAEESSNDEPMCYLLDASHSLAVSTLEELKNAGSQQQAIIHYLKPLSTFLHLIASLCASSSMVRSILTSEFLPDGLICSAMSVVSALAPLVASLNEADAHQISAEERSTIRYATTVIQSISTIAYLGGNEARDWIRKSLASLASSGGGGGPRMICNIALEVLPRRQNALEHECAALASSALNLLVDVLVDADVAFQLDALACFASSSSSFGGGDKMSGFAPYVVAGGAQGEITLAVMTILNCLVVNLDRNVFDPKSVSSGMVPTHVETIGAGVMVALDVLSTLVSSGEISFPTSRVQVAICHAILSSIVSALVGLKQVIYLHEDDDIRGLALTVRNDIINSLSSSTPLGQVVAFLASAPISLGLMKNVSSSKELSSVMDSAAAAQYNRENKRDDSKYGAWGKFVTPKRASQKRASRRRARSKSGELSENVFENVKEDTYSDLYDVVAMALSLLLVWGEHAEDIADVFPEGTDQNQLLQSSPCTLLLSRASPSSLQPHTATGLNVANLSLISRLASAEDAFAGGVKSNSALLSTKTIKMCLRHVNMASGLSYDDSRCIGLSAFRTALGGGSHMFKVLLDAFDKIIADDSSSEGMEKLVLIATIILESVAVSVSSQPDLARAILLGGEIKEDWRLVDKIVSCVMSTSDLMNASRDNPGSDERLLTLRSLLSCACLHVVSELWKSCRLTCEKQNSNSSDSNIHACGAVMTYLTNVNTTGTTSPLIANLVVELTRCSLLAIMSLEEKNSMRDEVSTAVVNQKCILLDLLTRSLDIIAIETVSRVQTKSQGGIKFVEDLFDSGPMECWKVILSSSDAAASSASSWLASFSSAVGKINAPNNWNIASFLRANPPEEEMSTSSWCSFGSAAALAKSLRPGSNSVDCAFGQCNALHVLAQGEASFAASWATFFEVVTSNVIASRTGEEVKVLTHALADSTLAALLSTSESKMISESMLSSQGLLEASDTQPVGELCSLLLYSLTVRRDFIEGQSSDCQTILEMIGRLYESSNKLFVLTQLGSVSPLKQDAVCLIRQNLLTSALVLMSEFESLPQDGRARDDIVKYNDLRIGFTNLAVNALQSLQYVQMGADDTTVVEDTFASKYGYGFGAVSENSADTTLSGQEAAFQLLRTSLSLLTHLAPKTIGSSSTLGDYQTYSYGVDFAACLKERNAINYLQYHLGTASTVASLTYQPVYAGSSSQSVAVIHNNAVDIVRLIITFFHVLTDSGSTIVDVLLLMMENRCFRSLIDNPLLKASCKTWTSNSGSAGVTRHRGYYTSFSRQAGNSSSASKSRPTSQKDSVHFVWREVVNIFALLLRSARCQAQIYAKVDEPILRQLIPATSAVLDFVVTYEHELFAPFVSMLSEAHAQADLSSKGGKAKSSSFSSSIQSSSFAFTPNLLKESADISTLFAELCKGDIKNEFARQCGGIFERVLATSRELTKITSSFLGSIGNARELFLALSSASTITMDQAAMFDAHPLLSDGIPNARHEAIRNAHYAHSCCILATAQDFNNSHIATTKAVEASSGKDKSLEQSFQIHVNNKFIAEVEQVAGHCLFNALSVLSDTHPASDSFISFSSEEATRLDVASVIIPGTTVAISSQTGAQCFQRYRSQPGGNNVKYACTLGCDRSTRTISVEYSDSGTVERAVSWSWIVGMEDVSKRKCVFSYGPTAKSIADADTRGPPSLGHLILALKWCRHVALASLDNTDNFPAHLIKCVAESASILLCTEVQIHEELRVGASRNDTARKVNMQLLDLFEYTDTESTGLSPAPPVSSHGNKSLVLAMGEDILAAIQKNLKRQLRAACLEREEEQKMWEQNNTGWDNTSFLGSSSKRQGRRSPFRLVRKASLGD